MTSVLGMLYIVQVRMFKRSTGETIKKKLLVVGGEQSDISKKLKWHFDVSEFDEFSITEIEKIRSKIHTLNTTVEQEVSSPNARIKTKEGTKQVYGVSTEKEKYDPNLYAVGVVTTMLGSDEDHALRKVGRALIEMTLDSAAKGLRLSDESTVTIDQIPKSSGYAKPRDVSSEVNNAHIFSGGRCK